MDVHQAVREGTFREDLLYRINTVAITLPPLRERKDDLPLLSHHFLSRFKQKYQKPELDISTATLKKLQHYAWPGNIRELRHAIERAVILSEGDQLEPADFLFPGEGMGLVKEIETEASLNLEQMERRMVQQALLKHQGNITKAAADLGLTRAALYRRMEKHGL
ncbi:MAG: helix-turn-helix domain-containing protein [Bacteroidota bacterium]